MIVPDIREWILLKQPAEIIKRTVVANENLTVMFHPAMCSKHASGYIGSETELAVDTLSAHQKPENHGLLETVCPI